MLRENLVRLARPSGIRAAVARRILDGTTGIFSALAMYCPRGLATGDRERAGVTGTCHPFGGHRRIVVRLPLSGVGDRPAGSPPKDVVVVPSLRVLVVEDNADSRDILRTMLEAEGHHVFVAEDGPAGVEVSSAVRPDVALIDIGLPGFDGYEVGRRIRMEHRQSIRLVAVTGYGQIEDRRRTSDAGFDAHLVKPVAPEDLRNALMKRPATA